MLDIAYRNWCCLAFELPNTFDKLRSTRRVGCSAFLDEGVVAGQGYPDSITPLQKTGDGLLRSIGRMQDLSNQTGQGPFCCPRPPFSVLTLFLSAIKQNHTATTAFGGIKHALAMAMCLMRPIEARTMSFFDVSSGRMLHRKNGRATVRHPVIDRLCRRR